MLCYCPVSGSMPSSCRHHRCLPVASSGAKCRRLWEAGRPSLGVTPAVTYAVSSVLSRFFTLSRWIGIGWVLYVLSCDVAIAGQDSLGQIDFLSDFQPVDVNGDVQVVIEIPSGSTAKWEVRNGKPRIVNYLGYPGHYGMIPGTLLPKSAGGDGDPLDAIVIGTAIERGEIVAVKLIGVMVLIDQGEQDDKLIAVCAGSPLFAVDSIKQLDEEYPGISEILEIWFSNYKGA